MKITRSTPNYPARSRRNPLVFPVILLLLVLAGLIAWFWSRGGDRPLTRVEKAIPAERLGH